MDLAKQIDYWRNGAEEDLGVAGDLLALGRLRHGLFFAELAVEKMLKAHVARQTRGVPPRTHDLLKLARLSGLEFEQAAMIFLARIQAWCLAGRYPDEMPPTPPAETAREEFARCKEVFAWLSARLNLP